MSGQKLSNEMTFDPDILAYWFILSPYVQKFEGQGHRSE